ncbi:ADP-dependent glucokinase/phosphofructokinase [Lachnospiraceae bacterium ZAX-1]
MKEKIILGLGDNIDYEIAWDSKVLERCVDQYQILDEELSTEIKIQSERDLVVSILGFLKTESGGERFVARPEIIETFVKNFQYKITLGGTPVRAAIVMRKLGYTSALHLVTMNEHVRRLIPHDSPYVSSAKEESSYPHLIVQFGAEAKVKASDIDICTSRSNRIIYDNDYDNIVMELNEDFAELMTGAKVFLVSGFNAMQSKELLATRLETLLRMMTKLPSTTLVFYEDAGFHTEEFSGQVRAALIKRIDIYSLNEDELQKYLERKLDLLNPKQMEQALKDLYQLIPAPLLVVHTRYWVLAYGENAGFYASAIKGGITMAGTRFRFGDDFTVEDYKETEQFVLQEQGVVFKAKIEELMGNKVCCLACIQADETNATTIGLGDSFVGGFIPALSACI